jgi:hypothetical protein
MVVLHGTSFFGDGVGKSMELLREQFGRGAVAAVIASVILSGCLGAGGSVTQGTGSTAVSGAAAGAASTDAGNIERCAQPFGTLAVDDGREAYWWGNFSRRTNVTTIEPLLRLAVQQSNCFVITSIGNQRLDDRMSRITQAQRESGEFRAGSQQQAGQRVAADYFVEPAIIIDDDSVGSLGGVAGALLGGVAGGIIGGLESKVSVVTMSLFDIRSQVQISAAEGSATSTNYGAAVAALGSSAGGAVGGLSRTPEGKATIAAFVDAYNSMIVALRNYEAQDVDGGLGTGGTLRVN